jgi:type II secretory pathway pseudopilin PulG
MFKQKLISSLLTANPNLKNQGFSWLWLIAIVGIGGVGLAIVLPSFLNTQSKCSPSGAKQYVGAMNRGQQAYFLEKHTFAKNLEQLGVGIKSKTENYQYLIETTPQAAFSYGVPLQTALRSYVGAAVVIPAAKNGSKSAENEGETIAIICEANAAGQTKPAAPVYQNGNLKCGDGTTQPR